MLVSVVPISFKQGASWLGGVNYFRNLLLAVNKYSESRIKTVVLTDRPDLLSGVGGEFGVVEHCNELNWRAGPLPFASRVFRRAGGWDFAALRAIQNQGAHVISHNHIGNQRAVPSLPWIPDFQHRALPHLFSKQEFDRRERNVAITAKLGYLLVSSESARNDFKKFYPGLSPTIQVHVLRFAAMGHGQPISLAAKLNEKYDLPDRFVFLPNQFWVHKNHGIVVDALARTRTDITVVCTGSASDYRNQSYFSDLIRRAEALGVSSRFRVLGVLPYQDVLSLMNQSLAVLNPSRFEGWSTTVEEAKLLGKTMLLSSIPVHREQAEDGARYFDADDAEALARLLDDASVELATNPSSEKLVSDATRRQRTFVDQYIEIISSVSSSSS